MNQKNSLGLNSCFLDLDDPIHLFDTWMEEAKKTEPNDPNAVALATSSKNNIPSVRMVLLKDFNQNNSSSINATPKFTLFDLADRLRRRGWQVPAYTLPANCENLAIQRILVRHGFTHDLANLLIKDFRDALAYFNKHPITLSISESESGGFNHS